jgi:uncharacterized protein YfdQ (DUF2303 family)
MQERTEADSVAQIVRQANEVTRFPMAHAEELLVFPDKSIVSLEKYAEQPKRKRASVALEDATSFARYVREHWEPGSVIFGRADEDGGSFAAVLDYHQVTAPTQVVTTASEAMTLADCVVGRAGWGNHRAEFALECTPEWSRWLANNRKALKQSEFAEFLEDNRADVLEPSGITLLEIAQTLQVKSEVNFRSGLRLDNGQVQLNYVEQIEGRGGVDGSMAIPETFKLALAPFVGMSVKYEISVRLRYRQSQGKLTFEYQLDRPHKVVETAFKEIRESIEKETGAVVLLGSLSSINAGI